MSTIQDIRDGIKANITATIPTLRVHDTVPNAIATPAAVVVPVHVSYDSTFGGTSSEYEFMVVLYVSRSSARTGQDQLDLFLDPTGPLSVKAAIESDTTLGGVVMSCHVVEAREYGIVEVSGATYLAAELGIAIISV